MADHPPWDEIKPKDSSRITRNDVKTGRKALETYQKNWNKSKTRKGQFPWSYLFTRVRICQILLRSGIDPSVLREAGGTVTDDHLPLPDDVVSSLVQDNPEAQEIFMKEQARSFGIFPFDRTETTFENDIFLPFLKEKAGQLGEGSFSTVDKVKYVHARASGEPVIFARKCPKENKPEMENLFINEAEILRNLGKHHHIVEFVGSYRHEHHMGIILYPAADGGNLEQYLRNGNSPNHVLLKRLFGCLSIGLSFLNNACSLRLKDIKPSNILIHGSDILFTDFGSAHRFTDSNGRTENAWAGRITQRYAAPEILLGSERNVKTDLFALGCIYAEVLTQLADRTVQELRIHMRAGQKDTSSDLYGENTPRLRKWLRNCCEGYDGLKMPLDWCLQMIEDMEKRPHIVDLVENMKETCKVNEELDTFFCSKCLEEFVDHESKSVQFEKAVQQEPPTEAKQLAGKGVDIDVRDRFGLTPLSHAARRGNMAFVELLLDRQADVAAEEPTEHFTPLHWAAKSRRTNIVRRLLGRSIDAKVKNEALRLAALNGDLDTVNCLLRSGATISDESTFGRGVLHQAAQSKNAELVRLLIQNGADVSATDMQGCTPLHLAAANGDTDVAKLLLNEMTADSSSVDVTDRMGRTPLHMAAFNGYIEVVELLVERGAAIERKDCRGRTSRALANFSQNDFIEHYLYTRGQTQSEEKKEQACRKWIVGEDGSMRRKGSISFALRLDPPQE